MGLFEQFLGFDGEVGRLGYLWRSVVAGVFVAAIVALAPYASMHVFDDGGMVGPEEAAREAIRGAALLGLWSGFASGTRRLRDMGFEPVYIAPLYAALWVVNAQLVWPLTRLQPEIFRPVEGAWLALQCAAAGLLLFWPTAEHPSAPRIATYEPVQPTAYLNWRESG